MTHPISPLHGKENESLTVRVTLPTAGREALIVKKGYVYLLLILYT